MHTSRFLLLISLVATSCVAPSKYKATKEVARTMWVGDPCGQNGARQAIGLFFLDTGYLDTRIKREKDVIRYLGKPDSISDSDGYKSYLYFIKGTSLCTDKDRVHLNELSMSVQINKDTKEILIGFSIY
jgi:hypothetical protein